MIEWPDIQAADEVLPDAEATGPAPVAVTPAISRATAEFFGEGSPLREAERHGGRPYEPRPQQAAMALHVAQAFEGGAHLCVEAPTGVGKTFAYLVPAILFALAAKKPVVVSTHTISLQEQILDKDAPLLAKLLGVPFRTALAKGRANYLCLRRLNAVLGGEANLYLPSEELLPDLEKLRPWAETTAGGSRSDLTYEVPHAVWETVCCEPGNCLAQNCPHYQACFLFKARRKLLTADLIVANHALFFSDLGMRRAAGDPDAGILPRYAAVVLDEAHTVEDTAAMHLGLHLTSYGLRKSLFRLYNPERHRGLLADPKLHEARDAVVRAAEHAERVYRLIFTWLDEAPQSNPRRYVEAGVIPDLLAEPLERAAEAVARVAKADTDPARAQEMRAVQNQIEEYREGFHQFCNMTLADHVYWTERQGSRGRSLALVAAPVEVGPLLKACLFNQDFPVVLTSATLAVRNSLAYFQRRIGADDAAAVMLDSPFDFPSQVTLWLPMDMPAPNSAEFLDAAAGQIKRFLLMTQGHAFVLFTSYRMMQDLGASLAEFFQESGLKLLMQGEGLPRTKLLENFRSTPKSVLFGTDSFWTGVDVPGDALVNVILVRLPFQVPDHPLVQARHELIERRGGRPFWEYSLPEAILKLRQGFGRLIRSRTDRGIVVILDHRIRTTSYGKAFLESLPPCRRQLFSTDPGMDE